jgi:hypothetical protein
MLTHQNKFLPELRNSRNSRDQSPTTLAVIVVQVPRRPPDMRLEPVDRLGRQRMVGIRRNLQSQTSARRVSKVQLESRVDWH